MQRPPPPYSPTYIQCGSGPVFQAVPALLCLIPLIRGLIRGGAAVATISRATAKPTAKPPAVKITGIPKKNMPVIAPSKPSVKVTGSVKQNSKPSVKVTGSVKQNAKPRVKVTGSVTPKGKEADEAWKKIKPNLKKVEEAMDNIQSAEAVLSEIQCNDVDDDDIADYENNTDDYDDGEARARWEKIYPS